MTPRASDKCDKFSPRGARRDRGDAHVDIFTRGVAAGADAEINLFRRGSRASRFFRAAGPHSRKNLDVARARRARAFEFERSVVSVGAVVSVKGRARASLDDDDDDDDDDDRRGRRASSSSRAASFIVRGRAAPSRNLTRRGRYSI